jgi:allantoin racemase
LRILVVNPNTSAQMTHEIGLVAKAAASSATEVVTISPARGVPSIESFAEDIIASYHMFDAVLSRAGQFDAVVVACFYDPGVEALRELLDVPVIGIAEAAMHVASLLAPKFSVITVLKRGVHHVHEVVRRAGLESKCASVRGVELGVLDIDQDWGRARAMIEAEARAAIRDDGAEVIVLGCAGMGPLDKELQQALGLPVVDGVACAVPLAELCLNYGVTTSKTVTFAALASKDSDSLDPMLATAYH